ncbi:MAG: Lysyl-tRNA synthetase class I [Candidatus Methanohalarchaeum thermophilum]|uniref:Lysine--tRNA ligase n=1 Tax=Methanohalarchaeum thermophilum TaxID=1903181 RepID=A0A1Q6DVA4_METT1|nr:MAG: Lysyl-tRNA synthetase class I [Candidatus Methanohalarchaeum thermophilum]
MHWADEKAENALRDKGRENVVASGISPSGPIHYGNFREILTADLLNKAINDQDGDSKLIWVLDDYDPLRKVYPFLDSDYEKHVGKPLSKIPDPEGCHESYAEHYTSQFVDALSDLGIEPAIHKASKMYKKGEYTEEIVKALKNRSKIKKIIEEVTNRTISENWLPIKPICQDCKNVSTTEAKDYEGKKVYYECECGYNGEADIRNGEAKLPWRVDWPARWKILGVTVEPFGKDHAADGGSYDTGKRIAKEIYDYEPPYPVVYEQIALKGEGEMSSSEGITLTPAKMLEFFPSEIIRYIIVRKKPNRHIELDTGYGMLHLMDDFKEVEDAYYEEGEKEKSRIYELSLPEKNPRDSKPPQPPFKHLVNATQLVDNLDSIKSILKRTGHWDDEYEDTWLNNRIKLIRNWLDWFAPEDMKFEVKENLPDKVEKLSKKQKKFLGKLADLLEENDYNDEQLNNKIFNTFQDMDMEAREAFESIYLALLGRDSGPRAAWFILSLDTGFVINRFREASKVN